MAAVDVPSTRAIIVGDVCERIATGESLSAIFAANSEHLPTMRTFWRWLIAEPDLAAMYERATAQRGEKYAEEIAAISDERPPKVNTQFGEHVDAGYVQWQKNRIDARKWVAARMLPRRYGDKVTLAGDADNPIAIVDQSAIAGKLLPELAAGGTSTPPSEPDER